MLVIEDRDAPAAGLEHVCNLAEEFIAGIEPLAHLIRWIAAVLGDEQHAVHGEFLTAQGERFGDRRIDLHLWELAGASPAQVVLGPLIDIERDEIKRRAVMARLPAVPD